MRAMFESGTRSEDKEALIVRWLPTPAPSVVSPETPRLPENVEVAVVDVALINFVSRKVFARSPWVEMPPTNVEVEVLVTRRFVTVVDPERRLPAVKLPAVNVPIFPVAAKRFVELAVVAKKFVLVAFVVSKEVPVAFWKVKFWSVDDASVESPPFKNESPETEIAVDEA